MITPHLKKLPPSIVTSVLQILIVILVKMGFLLKGHVPIGTALLLMKKPDNTVFHEVPQIEEDVTHLSHLCRVNPLVIHNLGSNAMFHLRSRATHKKHPEQVDAEISLKGDHIVIDHLHNATNIAILLILGLVDVLSSHGSGLAPFLSGGFPLGCVAINGFTYLATNTNVVLLLLIAIQGVIHFKLVLWLC